MSSSPTTTPPPVTASPSQDHDGTSPLASNGPLPARDGGERRYVAVTTVVVVLPFVALGSAGWLLWERPVHPVDLLIGTVLYLLTGQGVTAGFRRGLTHGGYRAVRPAGIALTVAGSLNGQSDVIDWAATHHRHHAFAHRTGDPRRSYRYGRHLRGQSRGLLHAHVGRLSATHIRALSRSRTFLALCVLTLALPFAAGSTIGGTWLYGVTGLLWAGLARVALLRRVAWSVSCPCQMIGELLFRSQRHDRATNLWPLAVRPFGESRHNLHHADPTSARQGGDRARIDPSAAAFRLLERLDRVHDVRRPTAQRGAARRA
jgi:stearoyl-CoA desaturase (delta-9 desaturase)